MTTHCDEGMMTQISSLTLSLKARQELSIGERALIKVCVVDDHSVVRRGIAEFLAEQMDVRIIGEGGSAKDALELLRRRDPDIMLLDVFMPGQSGIEILGHLLAHKPNLGVIFLSGYPEEHYALALLKKGAKGYLNKECDLEDIVRAIRTVALGRRYITPSVGDLLAQQMAHPTENGLPHQQLSERELQVFLRLASGQTVGQIAEALSLSAKSVSTYRTRTLEKLHLSSNSDLTYYALKAGLIR
jgi:two-component system, NarL family, invasion response regulator UvrY